MKKLSLFLIFFIFSCQQFDPEIEVIPMTKNSDFSTSRTHHQFESRNLLLQKFQRKKVKVALFLPLSGKHQNLGQSLANAALISLFEHDDDHNIEVILVDSKGSAKEAKKAFQNIIDQNIKIVIGPVFSTVMKEIEKDILKNSMTVISFSNNKKLMGKIDDEGGIFLAGMLPETQIDKIVSFAIKNGKNNFAIIAPNNQYGNTLTKMFRNIVKDRDGNFITSEFYRANNRDISRAVDRTINSFTISSELRELLKTDKETVIEESDRQYPDIIMIPESGKILSKIVYFINGQNINEREFQLIGTSQWDDNSTLNDDSLKGAWFPAPANHKFSQFQKKYYKTYNEFPLRISSIAYDSLAAISQMIKKKKGKTPTITDLTNYSKTSENGFDGIDGLFRFLPNGLVQRNLAVLEVDDNYFRTVEAPTSKFLAY